MPVENFISTHQRVFILYLLTSLLMAYLVYRNTQKKPSFLRYIFPKKVWWGSSSRIDYVILVVNGFVKAILITPLLFIGVFLQHYINDALVASFGIFPYDVSLWLVVAVYTIMIWLVGDFASFFIHFMMHRIPFLWEFHKVHHSATVLTPFTQYRIHPIELVLNNLKSLMVYGLVTGVFYYLAAGEVGTLTFIGVNVFTFLFLALGSNLRHSHVKFKFPPLMERIFISPFQHQIHHSDAEQHFNKNLGSHLAIWDLMFGTLVLSKEVKKIRFGLGKEENEDFDSSVKSLKNPFVKAFKAKK